MDGCRHGENSSEHTCKACKEGVYKKYSNLGEFAVLKKTMEPVYLPFQKKIFQRLMVILTKNSFWDCTSITKEEFKSRMQLVRTEPLISHLFQ